MEYYEGIKFKTRKLGDSFVADERLPLLNYWIAVFGELGLAPVHPEGAYGNHSYRVSKESFLITRTGMIPRQDVDNEDYCVVQYDKKNKLFLVKGRHEPSSECYLHSLIYSHFPKVNTVMHGHSTLLNNHANDLKIPVTSRKFPYGTVELAHSAIELISSEQSFFILKNHGFVATGEDIDSTAQGVLSNYMKLLEMLKGRAGS